MKVKDISDLMIKDSSDKKMKPEFFSLNESAENHEAMKFPKEKIVYILEGKIELVAFSL